MLISNLIPTHNELRSKKKVDKFIKRIRKGNLFRGMKSPIKLTRTEDGLIYVHDGHHRLYACYLCGIKELMNCEFIIKDMTYDDYNIINIKNGWLTPFNLKTEVRKADFFEFKDKLSQKIKLEKTVFISKELLDTKEYIEARRIWTIGDLTCQ